MLKSCLGCCKLEIGGYMIGCVSVVLEVIYLIRKSLITWNLINKECEGNKDCSQSRTGSLVVTVLAIITMIGVLLATKSFILGIQKRKHNQVLTMLLITVSVTAIVLLDTLGTPLVNAGEFSNFLTELAMRGTVVGIFLYCSFILFALYDLFETEHSNALPTHA